MSERESHASRMAKEAFAVNLFEKEILQLETKYLTDLLAQYEALRDLRPVEAEEVLSEIIKEKKRQDPSHKWDQEEVTISIIERKNRGNSKKRGINGR